MADQSKTLQELTAEIAALKERIRELETTDNRGESWIEAILSHSSLQVRERDIEGRYLPANPVHSQYFNVSPTQVIGAYLDELFPPEIVAVFMARIARVKETGKSINVEDTMPTDDGMRHFITTLVPLTDETGEVRRNVSIAQDITGVKKAEEALAHSHDLMRYIIEHNRSAVAVHDKNMRYLYVSQRYLDEYKGDAQPCA